MSFLKDLVAPIRSAVSRALLGANSRFPGGGDSRGGLRWAPVSSSGNPVLTASDVTDYGAVSFVADPFLHITDDAWHLFFEVQNGQRDPTAVIGHATSGDEGETWAYDKVVLEYVRHLSFPYVFDHGGEVYMTPGQGGDPAERPVTLFRAVDFPRKWEPVVDLIDPRYGPLDPVVFRHCGRWWLVVGGGENDMLYAYYSDSLGSPGWSAHDLNPVVTDRVRAGRPAGRPLTGSGDPVLYLQDNERQYGDAVRAYRITELSPSSYLDEPIHDEPMLAGGGSVGWNAGRMHHVDARNVGDDGRWIGVVDGDVAIGRSLAGSCWSIGAYALDGPPIDDSSPQEIY
jgi:hypothetical protein